MKICVVNILLGLLMIVGESAANIGYADLTTNVYFVATIKSSTCQMSLEGGTAGGGDSYTIPVGSNGKVGAIDIINGTENAMANFSLDIIECDDGISKINVTVSGTPSSTVSTALKNNHDVNAGGAENVGLTIARQSAMDSPFVINSTLDSERLVWTATEISNKAVPLVARLVKTSDKITAGDFSTIATFNFTYE
ncbi:fimbrial protein [Citrobacter youngae]|uniref:Fimbrial protein n=1 Tax=Citrobacter youngae ATCC 29220 TaxID=500640 RepID=D4BKI4_9ENTR|nr:fimbrial protein [Citrobacter youngae]EFE05615.1 fimbrial protein [Citrobacter youngae ATCC 29220]